MKKKKRIVLVDADILVFRTSAICEVRSVDVKHNKSGRVKAFKNKTAFKDFLKEKDFIYTDSDYTITEKQTLNEDISYKFLLDNQIKSLKETLWPDEIRFLISGDNNFRDSLALPTKYKGSRDSLLKPLVRQECKEYLIGKYEAEVIHGCETDDALVYCGYEEFNKGHEIIVVSNDKDSHAYTGLKLYNYTHEKPEIVEIPKLGSLWLDDKNKVRGLGFLFFALQMGIGDLTDSYRPTEIAGIKFGEKSMYTLLKDCESEQEALQVVISRYMAWYPKRLEYTDWTGKTHSVIWKDLIDLYFKCVRMRETKEDTLNFEDFAKRYGVDLDNYLDEVTA